MKPKFNFRQIIYFIIGLIGISFIAALQMKLNIGIGPWDGLGRSISYVTNLKVGNISMIQSISCVLLAFILLRNNFRIADILTLVVGLLLGSMINYFFYTFLGNLVIESYIIKLILFVLSIFVSAFFVSIVQTAEFVSLPLENLCQVIADKTNKSFAFIRQMVDVFCVISIVLLTLLFNVDLTLREGTIISMIVFGPAMGFFMPRLTDWLIKMKILPERTPGQLPSQL